MQAIFVTNTCVIYKHRRHIDKKEKKTTSTVYECTKHLIYEKIITE